MGSSEIFLHGVDRAPAPKVADFLILCARVERHYGARDAVSVAAKPPPAIPFCEGDPLATRNLFDSLHHFFSGDAGSRLAEKEGLGAPSFLAHVGRQERLLALSGLRC